jgi:hypothetical protein
LNCTTKAVTQAPDTPYSQPSLRLRWAQWLGSSDPTPKAPSKGQIKNPLLEEQRHFVILEPANEILLALSQNVQDLIGNPEILSHLAIRGNYSADMHRAFQPVTW